MSVKKKIIKDIDSFIDKGAHVKVNKDKIFKNVLIRVPSAILDRVDASLEKRPWLNRTQWIVEALYEKLKDDVKEEEKGLPFVEREQDVP